MAVEVYTNCFKKLIGKKKVDFFTRPFEETHEDFFGELDDEQKKFVKNKAMPIVLTENASDVVAKLKDSEDFLETVFEQIIQELNNDWSFIGSFSLPHYYRKLDKINKKKIADKFGNSSLEPELAEEKEYTKIIQKIKGKIKGKKMIIHIADIISEASGHYAVLIVEEDGKVILFDSMQRKNEKGFSGGGSSFYTAFFAQVAMDVLGVGLDDITCPKIPSCDEKCLQITGGFIEYDDLAQTLGREPTESEKYVYMQNADSQNHFCYF